MGAGTTLRLRVQWKASTFGTGGELYYHVDSQPHWWNATFPILVTSIWPTSESLRPLLLFTLLLPFILPRATHTRCTVYSRPRPRDPDGFNNQTLDLELTLCRLGSHSVDFASLRSPRYHLISSSNGIQDGVRFPFAGWACM